MTYHESQPSDRLGLTLIEVVMVAAIFTVLMVAATVNLHRDSEALRPLARKTPQETKADVMIDQIERQLEFARGPAEQAFLRTKLDADEAKTIEVDTTWGFPDRGVLLVGPGTLREERIRYQSFDVAPGRFMGLTRQELCTAASSHDNGTLVRWAGMAVILEGQVDPSLGFYDGISQELFGQVFYRGDGTGFSFRVPAEPAGEADLFDDTGKVRWDAVVEGNETLDDWSCLFFDPVAVITEAARGTDLNSDGDRDDIFELGRISMRSWNALEPDAPATEIALCPPMVLQEQCAWGSDLDNDGFQDPIFLWKPVAGRLRLRLFLLTSNETGFTEVRLVERAMFLRNGSQS